MQKTIDLLKDELKDDFLIFFNENVFLEDIKKTSLDIPSEYEDICNSFIESLSSVISLVSIVENMSFTRAKMLVYQTLLTQERILGTTLDELSIEEEKLKKLKENEKARETFAEKLDTIDGRQELRLHTLLFIRDCYHDSDLSFKESSQNLVKQSVVLTWSALEIIVRDIFILYLNKKPQEVKKIYEDAYLKKKFDFSTIKTETLLEYGFNVSTEMGNVLIEKYDFSNIEVIRKIYDVLFCDAELNSFLKDNTIWNLYKRRNLIVHKGAWIDKKYIAETGDATLTGSKLTILPKELVDYLNNVKNIGIQLFKIIIKNQH